MHYLDRLLPNPTPLVPVVWLDVVALVRADEQYVLLYDRPHRTEALRTLGRWASDPTLGFTWYDAAVLEAKIRGEGRRKSEHGKTDPAADCEEEQ